MASYAMNNGRQGRRNTAMGFMGAGLGGAAMGGVAGGMGAAALRLSRSNPGSIYNNFQRQTAGRMSGPLQDTINGIEARGLRTINIANRRGMNPVARPGTRRSVGIRRREI
jgi:hypothetical protein